MPKPTQAQKRPPDLNTAIPKGAYIDPGWLDVGQRDALLRVGAAKRSLAKKPVFNGFILVETENAVVDDPYSTIGEKTTQKRVVRDDPLADMLSRKVIEIALFNAGRKWEGLHECTQIGPISAIDPGKEAVDGGKPRDPITDRQIDAFKELADADRRLGQMGAQLIRQLLAQRMTVGKMCEHHGCKTGRQQSFLSMRVRECLEDLGKLWGFVG